MTTIKFLLFCLITQSIPSYAEVSGGCETALECSVRESRRTPVVNTSTTAAPIANTTTTTTNFVSAGEANSGTYEKAAQAQNTSMITTAVATAAAAQNWARCGRRSPTPCIIAAALTVTAGLAMQAAGQAGSLMNSLGGSGQAEGQVDRSTTADASVLANLNKIKAGLEDMGYSADENGNIKLPSGSTVNSDLSEQSLKSAGLTEAEAAAVQNQLQALKKDLRDKAGAGTDSLLASGSGSSGYGRVSISSLDGSDKEVSAVAERTDIDSSRDPASWGGFYKRFGDSVIGIDKSDIFLMVEKRVEKERTGMEH